MFYRTTLNTLVLLFFTSVFLMGQTVNDNLVTIDAEDANLATILSIIAEDSDYNIVTGPSVSENKK